jgi:hypothetical protein
VVAVQASLHLCADRNNNGLMRQEIRVPRNTDLRNNRQRVYTSLGTAMTLPVWSGEALYFVVSAFMISVGRPSW